MKTHMLRQIKKSKKGVSEIIGYILLIAFVIITSIIVYRSLKTYVPKEMLECPDGVSLYIENYSCFFSEGEGIYAINLTLRNNGQFSIAGYFPYISNSPEQETATINISDFLNTTVQEDSSIVLGSAILFSRSEENTLLPGESRSNLFLDMKELGTFYSIQIIPARFEDYKKDTRFTTCTNAKIEEVIECTVI